MKSKRAGGDNECKFHIACSCVKYFTHRKDIWIIIYKSCNI